MARRDWIHWITSAKKAETRARVESKMRAMLAAIRGVALLMALVFLSPTLSIRLAGSHAELTTRFYQSPDSD